MHDHVRTGSSLHRHLLTPVVAVALAVVAFAMATALRRGLLDASYEKRSVLDEDVRVLASPGSTTMALLGMEHNLGVAELTWLALVGELSKTSDPVRVEQLAYLSSDLDPKYEIVYWAAAVGLADSYEFDASDRVAKRGVEALPDVWRFQFLLGYNAYFGHADAKAASEFWRNASHQADAPKYMAALAARALFHAGAERSAEQMLVDMIPLLPERQREDAIMRLAVLRSEYRFRRFDEACERFFQERGHYPLHAEELRVRGYVDEPPFDFLESPIKFDDGTCVSRSELVFVREAEAAKRIGFMKSLAERRNKHGIAAPD